MDFLIDFLRTLNSAGNKKLIALAVVLGLISGFLPTFTPINYLIFVIVLIFRVPLGLYLASFSVFKVFSVVLDPLFNKIGLFLLKLQALNGFWTYLYNLPLMRWSGFNNSLVLGSLVVGVIVGIVAFIFLDKAIGVYREFLRDSLKDSKFLKFLMPEEKKGLIRISGIAVVLVIGAIIYLLLPQVIRIALEFGISRATQKKVAIKEVVIEYPNAILINHMQIDNFLIKRAYAKLNLSHLLFKKYDIENLEFSAKTNENIATLLKIKSQNKINTPKIKIPLPSAKEILNDNLKTPKAIEKLLKDYEKVKKEIKKLDIKTYEVKAKEIEKELKSFKNIKVKSPQDLQALIAKINKLQKDIDSLKIKIENDKKMLISAKNLLLNDIKNLKTALKEDYKFIDSKYSMLKNGQYINFASSFFEEDIKKYIEMIKEHLKNKEPKKEIIRADGVVVKFEDKIKYPDFVIRNLKGELKTSIAKWNLVGLNLSNNQRLLNKKAILKMSANSKFYNAFIKVAYLKDIEYNGYFKNIKLKKIDLDKLTLLNPIIDNNFSGKNLNAKIKATFKKVKILYKGKNRYIKDVIESINSFYLIVKIENEKIKISSNIDKILSQKLNKLFKKEANKAKKLLQKRVNEALKRANLSEINLDLEKINSVESLIENLKKEAFKIIEKKKKEALNKGVEKLFNKFKF